MVADLIEISVDNPPAAAPIGSNISTTDTAQNQGNANAGTSTTRYYLSVDKIKSTGDILLTGSRSVPALAAGESSTGTVEVTIPSNSAAANYYLLACADDMEAVDETSDTNNCISSGTKVQVAP